MTDVTVETISYGANIVLALVSIWGIVNERKYNRLKILFGVIKGWSKQVQSMSNSNSMILSKIRSGALKNTQAIEAALDTQGCFLNGLHVSFQEEIGLADEIIDDRSNQVESGK